MRCLIFGLCIILLTFSCAPHWSVHQINTAIIQVNEQPGFLDSTVESIVIPYRDSIEQEMSKLVTVNATPLIKGKPESTLTNLVADILLEFGMDFCRKQNLNLKPDLAYVNYGGLRASLPQGEVTVARIFELMPFENEIVLIRISGAVVQQLAERIAARGGEGISGMTLGIRNEKPGMLKLGGKAVDLSASYWLVTSDYIANGGDQMSMFLNPPDRINTHMKFRDVLIQELHERYKKDGVLEVKPDGRIYHEQ